jgi:hypothetical protein
MFLKMFSRKNNGFSYLASWRRLTVVMALTVLTLIALWTAIALDRDKHRSPVLSRAPVTPTSAPINTPMLRVNRVSVEDLRRADESERKTAPTTIVDVKAVIRDVFRSAKLRRSISAVNSMLASNALQPRMSPVEHEALIVVLCRAAVARYFEYGSGGSSIIAGACNVPVIYSVDSAQSWLDVVAENTVWRTSTSRLETIFVDIGPTKEWGHPVLAHHGGFDRYSRAITNASSSSGIIDVLLVDGRFRIDCALRAVSSLSRDSYMLMHDYLELAERKYDVVEQFYDRVAQTDSLALFKLKASIDHELLGQYQRRSFGPN